jgi:type IV secretion system protein VirD4
MISSCPPIRAKKVRYYEDPQLQARILPPPRATVIAGAEHRCFATSEAAYDWTDAVVARSVDDIAADTANSGICREPEMSQHEDIAPPPRSLVREFDPFEDADDDAQRVRAMQRQARGIAHQAALDPADNLGL